jgi:RNA polymerase sigma factor (sigma-70 family)
MTLDPTARHSDPRLADVLGSPGSQWSEADTKLALEYVASRHVLSLLLAVAKLALGGLYTNEDAEDVVFGFLGGEFADAAREFDPRRGSLLSFVKGCIRRSCLKFKRKLIKHPATISLTTSIGNRPEQVKTDLQIIDPSPDPQVRSEQQELQEALQRGLNKLPDPYRKMIILRHFSQRSYAEIAAAFGITETNARVRVFRARQMLKAIMTRGWP